MRVLLTGSTGVVGRAILERLEADGYPVLALARNPASIPSTRGMTDVLACSFEAIPGEAAQRIAAFAPGVVIHAGWMGTENTNRNDPELLLGNLTFCLKLFEATAASCKHWVVFGSQAEYSPGLLEDIRENMPTFPDSAYGVVKVSMHHVLEAMCTQYGMTLSWLRLFSCYSKYYKPTYLIPSALAAMNRGEYLQVRNPDFEWDYLHADDMADGVMRVLRQRHGGVYNLAYGSGVTVRDILLTLGKVSGFTDMRQLEASLASKNEPPARRVADVRKFKETFQWFPRVTLEDGLRTFL